MPDSLKQIGLRIISSQQQSPGIALARTALSCIEPLYAGVTTARNIAFDLGILRTRDLGRPTISVGNITTGGTGKTPVVLWLAECLRRDGHRPAILLRGYRSKTTERSDEATLLDEALNENQEPKIPVAANPSRVAGAAVVLRDHPEISHLILDDGFQHRRARRDFNLVLISATRPFGYGHVLPRGLLRESLGGLGRADAFLITRCSLVSGEMLGEIEALLQDRNPVVPIFHCDHDQSSIWLPVNGQRRPIETLRGMRVFLTAGIGDPAAFERQISSVGSVVAGAKWWPDHHPFKGDDLRQTFASAKTARADLLLTTQKDWVKLKAVLSVADQAKFAVVELEIRFRPGDEEKLKAAILAAVRRSAI